VNLRSLAIKIVVTLAAGLALGKIVVWYIDKDMLEVSFTPPPAGSPQMHVIFLGNSYTFVNDLPHMVGAIAASDTANPMYIQTEMGAIGGATLGDLWKNQDMHDLFMSRHWDYLVLQESSLEATQPAWFAGMQRGMTSWSGLAADHNTKTLIYETWARKPGSDWYDNSKYQGLNLGSPDQMQTQVDTVTNTLAEQLKATVVPVGDVWQACRTMPGAPQLYANDGTHPSVEGTYLTALLFYQQLTGHGIDHVTYAPEKMSPDNAQFIRKCAVAKPSK
jgi:hypothetical protein